MFDSRSVITHAVNGHVKELAQELDVSLTRCYEMLGDQCHYAKAKRLIKAIATVNPDGAQLIKADMLAFFEGLLGPETDEVPDAKMHRELSEALQAKLDGKTRPERLKEDIEAISVLSQDIENLQREDINPIREQAATAVHNRRNGK